MTVMCNGLSPRSRIASAASIVALVLSACIGEASGGEPADGAGASSGASGASGHNGGGDGGDSGASGHSGGGSSGDGAGSGDGGESGAGMSGSGGDAGEGGGGDSGDGDGGDSGDGSSGDGGDSGQGGDPPPAVCEPSIELYPTAGPQVVGDGTPGSCTESALRTLAQQGGTITFNCGADPVTIDITQTIELQTAADTIIDGGGLITLDAGKRTRHFHFESANWMTTQTKLVVQRLKMINGKAPLGEYFPPVDGFPECAYGYKEGAGGAIWMRDGVLHVIDCEFYDNEAALIGPDVGGGAIAAQGMSSVVISGSRFVGNTGSNGGAITMLFANPEIYNSYFEDNTAVGVGQNRAVTEELCPAVHAFGHPNQAGAGGNGGAVYFDGPSDEGHSYVICGSTFRNNRSNELAGALFRTPNIGLRNMRISDCTFDSNTAPGGGVSFIMQNDLVVERSTFMNNQSGKRVNGDSVGGYNSGLWVHAGSLHATNSTFYNNEITVSEGLATFRNATISASRLPDSSTVSNSLFVDCACDGSKPGDHNVQWPNGTACASGTTFADPGVGVPADNGGSTWTMLPSNAAAVSGVGADCPSEDQRGEAREINTCAAGAVEL